MDLFVVGLNHQTAPIEVRERIAITEPALPAALAGLRARSFREAAILSTCNRTEIYAIGGTPDSAISFLSEFHNIPRAQFDTLLYTHVSEAAVIHLHRVAAGLDSLVLGEPQILGQVREAFASAAEAGAAGQVLNSLFRSAITAGKRVRTETAIGRGGFSIGHAALDLARSIFGSLADATTLILGAGKMSELTAKHLSSSGVRLILVANRTFEKASTIAERLGGRAIGYDDFPDNLAAADIVITSTASPFPVVTKEMVASVLRRRRGRALFIIDIAMPRDVETQVRDLDNVFLYDLDDLQAVVSDMAQERAKEIPQAEAIAREESHRFMAWYHGLEAVPVLTSLKRKHEEIRMTELQRLRNQLPELPDDVWQRIDTATRSMINRVTRDPVDVLKAAAAGTADPPEVDLLLAAQQLFALSNGAPKAASAEDLDSLEQPGEIHSNAQNETSP